MLRQLVLHSLSEVSTADNKWRATQSEIHKCALDLTNQSELREHHQHPKGGDDSHYKCEEMHDHHGRVFGLFGYYRHWDTRQVNKVLHDMLTAGMVSMVEVSRTEHIERPNFERVAKLMGERPKWDMEAAPYGSDKYKEYATLENAHTAKRNKLYSEHRVEYDRRYPVHGWQLNKQGSALLNEWRALPLLDTSAKRNWGQWGT